MPSKTAKQRFFMTIAAHDKEFAKKAGIDPAVAKEFHEADKAKDKASESKDKTKSKK